MQDDDESATVDDIATRARKYLRKDLELKLAEGGCGDAEMCVASTQMRCC